MHGNIYAQNHDFMYCYCNLLNYILLSNCFSELSSLLHPYSIQTPSYQPPLPAIQVPGKIAAWRGNAYLAVVDKKFFLWQRQAFLLPLASSWLWPLPDATKKPDAGCALQRGRADGYLRDTNAV
ncbi:MAG: hypothetical protein R6V16_08230 [Bacteroidales bacterium]